MISVLDLYNLKVTHNDLTTREDDWGKLGRLMEMIHFFVEGHFAEHDTLKQKYTVASYRSEAGTRKVRYAPIMANSKRKVTDEQRREIYVKVQAIRQQTPHGRKELLIKDMAASYDLDISSIRRICRNYGRSYSRDAALKEGRSISAAQTNHT